MIKEEGRWQYAISATTLENAGALLYYAIINVAKLYALQLSTTKKRNHIINFFTREI